MQLLTKVITAIIAPLLLAGCLLIPGKFNSKLTLMKDGSYDYSYSGEMQFFDPDNDSIGTKNNYPPFDEGAMKCYNQIDKKTGEVTARKYEKYFYAGNNEIADHPYRFEKRECTDKEKTNTREEYDRGIANKKQNNAEKMAMFSSIFGGAIPGNDEQLKKFAAQLEKYDGWNKVDYLGDDKFYVDYAISGQFDQNFTFPSLPGASMQFPFVQIIRRSGGELEVLTPAMSGPAVFAEEMVFGSTPRSSPKHGLIEISGTFVIETNGEVLNNNSEDGYINQGPIKKMSWTLDDKNSFRNSPRAIIKLSR